MPDSAGDLPSDATSGTEALVVIINGCKVAVNNHSSRDMIYHTISALRKLWSAIWPRVQKIYLVTGRTDMRKSFDGLMDIIRDNFQMEPFSNVVFLFCRRKKNTMKALYFDRDGFVFLQKRLDNGKFQWPRNASEVRSLTRQEFLICATCRFWKIFLQLEQAAGGRYPQMWDRGDHCPGIAVHDFIMLSITSQNRLEDVGLVCCLAHARRKFFEAVPAARRKKLKFLQTTGRNGKPKAMQLGVKPFCSTHQRLEPGPVQ